MNPTRTGTYRPYKTDYERVMIPHVPPAIWDLDTMETVSNAFSRKGYTVNCSHANNVRGDRYPSLEITRNVVQEGLEVLFRNRIDVELHIQHHSMVNILLLDYVNIEDLLRTIKYMPRYGGK